MKTQWSGFDNILLKQMQVAIRLVFQYSWQMYSINYYYWNAENSRMYGFMAISADLSLTVLGVSRAVGSENTSARNPWYPTADRPVILYRGAGNQTPIRMQWEQEPGGGATSYRLQGFGVCSGWADWDWIASLRSPLILIICVGTWARYLKLLHCKKIEQTRYRIACWQLAYPVVAISAS